MIEITPIDQPERPRRGWLKWLSAGAAIAVAAGTLGFVAGRTGDDGDDAGTDDAAAAETTPAEPDANLEVAGDRPTDAPSTVPMAAAEAAASMDSRSASGGGGGQYSPGAWAEEPGALVAERAVGDVTLRTHLYEYGAEAGAYWPEFPDWRPASWCYPTGNLRVGIASPTVINTAYAPYYLEPKDGVAVSTFAAGYVEGAPMFGAVAQVAPDVTSVTFTTAGGSSDSSAPQNGIALLLVGTPIEEQFSITIERADGSTATLDVGQLAEPWNDTEYQRACNPPPPALPAPGEQPADPAAADGEVRAAFAAAQDSDADPAAREQHIDDVTGISAAWRSLADGEWAAVAQEATSTITELVFTGPTEAWFRYDLLTPASNFYDRYGQARLADGGRWVITRQTICQDLALAPGNGCQPAVEQLLPPSASNDPRYNPRPMPMVEGEVLDDVASVVSTG